MRYRKNINCLTANELHDLREALAAMYALPAADPNSFAKLASFHGGPPTAYCAHGAPGFFTWHRAYLMAFENALRVLGCQVTLPYWDWSSGPSTGVPAACRQSTYMNRAGAAVANPLFSGPRPAGGQPNRRADIDTTAFDDLATTAQAAMSAGTFASFQNQISATAARIHTADSRNPSPPWGTVIIPTCRAPRRNLACRNDSTSSSTSRRRSTRAARIPRRRR